jgi:hypothetical protein
MELDAISPYMLLVESVGEDKMSKLPCNHQELLLREKPYFIRS